MNYHAWAEFYDAHYASTTSDEVDFYVSLARERGGPVLEVGVGTGRVAIAIADLGISVTGIDLHESMLDRARNKVDSAKLNRHLVRLFQADMRSLSLGKKFQLVFIPARTLLLNTSVSDQLDTLAAARDHLFPGGHLVFNIYVPDAERLYHHSKTPFLSGDVIDPESGHRCLFWTLQRYNISRQLDLSQTVVEEIASDFTISRKVILDSELRYLYPTEAIRLVERSGMTIIEAWGSFGKTPFNENSEELILVCGLKNTFNRLDPLSVHDPEAPVHPMSD
mgnify:CR=1 FL=1